jgi:hypothetical protein
MNSIEKFNHVNNTASNRFEAWEKYRNQLTTILLKEFDCSNHTLDQILLLAAGNCDDIDLLKLAQCTNKILLSDVDIKSLQNAEKRYQEITEKIQLLPSEYTGLASHEKWNDFIYIILQMKTKSEIDLYIQDVFNTIEQYTFLTNYEKKMDGVILAPIYTQLLYQQLLTNLNVLKELRFNRKLIDYLQATFFEKMPKLITTFNKNIIRLLHEKGTLIVISDIFEVEKNSTIQKTIENHYYTLGKMDEYYEIYQNEYGYGFGDFGLADLERHLQKKRHYWLKWPFSDKNIMYVKIVRYQL